jgi:putative membrane protein
MKNTVDFKSILAHFLFVAGSLLIVSSCSDYKGKDSKKMAKQEYFQRLTVNDTTILVIENEKDSEFLIKAAEMQLGTIQLGKLAQEKGDSAHVKELGRMMEDSNTKSQNEIKALAQLKAVAVPTSVTEDSKDAYKELNDENGNDFGMKYSKMMVDQHEDAIDWFEKAALDAEDASVRDWASKQLPILRENLKHAEACQEKCEKVKS